jgi:predicted CXXCH cytochrome family protein
MRMPRHFSYFPRLAVITSVSFLCFSPEQSFAGSYLLSAHGGSNPSSNSTGSPPTGKGVKRSSVANVAGNCAHCHEQHATLGGAGPANYLLFDTLEGNAICISCHNGSVPLPVDNIASQFSKLHKHDPNSLKGKVLCNDCHNSHIAQNTNHIEGAGNAASGPLLAVAGVSVNSWPIPGNPPPGSDAALAPGTPTLNNIYPISMEYQLCLKCHGGQIDYASKGVADLRGQFNPYNFSVHPVATETFNWKNAYLLANPTALKNPWNTTTTPRPQMYCSDCHGSDNPSDPTGPHGSSNFFILKAYGPGITMDNLCNKCHDVTSSAWVEGPGNPDPLLNGDHTLPQHQYPSNTMGCAACHGGINGALVSNVHGANYLWPNYLANPGRPSTEFLVGGLITQNYYMLPGTDTRGNRRCASSCHLNDGGAGYTY